MDLSKLFHQSSKDPSGGGLVRIPHDHTLWPKEWREAEYKVYERVPHVALPPAASGAVASAIAGRKSVGTFSPDTIGLQTLSTLLKYVCGEIGGTIDGERLRRAQPSAGGLYPIEMYYLCFRESADLHPGVYHYAPREHRLDLLARRHFSDKEITGLYDYSWVKSAGGVLILTAVFNRTQQKYGERGYRYVLLEAGHIAQNVYLLAGELGLGCRSLVGGSDESIEKLLDIDGVTESVVYSVGIGKLRQ